MTARTRILSLYMMIVTAAAAGAQTYDLGWERVHEFAAPRAGGYTLDWDSVSRHVDRAAATPRPTPVEEKPAPVSLLRRPKPAPSLSSAFAPQPQAPEPTYDIEFSSSRYYDVYAARYLEVKAVEVETFGRGTYTSERFENRGGWSTYPVYLNDLKEGDRFRVRVIWADGSNRTIDKYVDSYTGHTIYIGEPDHLAYSAW